METNVTLYAASEEEGVTDYEDLLTVRMPPPASGDIIQVEALAPKNQRFTNFRVLTVRHQVIAMHAEVIGTQKVIGTQTKYAGAFAHVIRLPAKEE